MYYAALIAAGDEGDPHRYAVWVGLSGGAAGSVSTRVFYEDGVEIVSGLSVDVCECS